MFKPEHRRHFGRRKTCARCEPSRPIRPTTRSNQPTIRAIGPTVGVDQLRCTRSTQPPAAPRSGGADPRGKQAKKNSWHRADKKAGSTWRSKSLSMQTIHQESLYVRSGGPYTPCCALAARPHNSSFALDFMLANPMVSRRRRAAKVAVTPAGSYGGLTSTKSIPAKWSTRLIT